MTHFTRFVLVLVLLAIASSAFAQTPEVTIKIDYNNKSYYGKPLGWTGKAIFLLRRDGRTSLVPSRSSRDFETVANEFKPFSRDLLRTRLQKEFGRKYQVSVTQNFVVVHPPGDFQKWAQPFEVLYQRFRAYFSSRGFELKPLEFPLVAVVLRTRNEFDRFLVAYHDSRKGVVGYYSPMSNRIITYDQSAGREDQLGKLFTSDTIVHEATHQTAFNTGIHNRFGTTPNWITEGLASMFEADGVNNSLYHTRRPDRINRTRLLYLQDSYRRNIVQGTLEDLVQSDRLFESDPQFAYALAWGVTFYLAEKQPEKYFEYLRNDQQRENYSAYSPQERLRDFAEIFGSDFNAIESRLERFIMDLDAPDIAMIKTNR